MPSGSVTPAGGSTPTLAQVLTKSGDPATNPITGPLSVTDGGSNSTTLVSVARDDGVGWQVIANTLNAISATDFSGHAFYAGRFGLIFQFNAAPADGDLDPGQCGLWFDSTNGAAALNVKAKQANGTVKTATIPVIT